MIKNIVISGGGFKGLAFVGCLKYLEETQDISYIQNYVGISAGSIMCFALCLGMSISKITEVVKKILMIEHDLESIIPDPLSMLDTYGLTKGSEITQIFTTLLHEVFPDTEDITFIELAKKTGKNLVVTVSNLSKRQTEYFCLDTYPDASVIMALKMSCAYPLVVEPVSFNDNLYVDGCLYCQLPLSYLESETFSNITTIGLLYTDPIREIRGFTDYLEAILFSPWQQWCSRQIDQSIIKSICKINIVSEEDSAVQLVSLTISEKEFESYISQGYTQMKDYMISQEESYNKTKQT